MRTAKSPELASAVADVFGQSDSGGRAVLTLASELTVAVMRQGRDDVVLTIPTKVEVFFPHNQSANHGQGRGVTRRNRSPRRFVITAFDNSVVLSVNSVSADGTMDVVNAKQWTPSTRTHGAPALSNLAAASS